MKRKKSLCESCSNKLIIKFHKEGIKPLNYEPECFYDFKVYGNSGNFHVAYVIVDECSFYNKSVFLPIRNKVKEVEENTDDKNNDENNSRSGVTFVNIPGGIASLILKIKLKPSRV